MDKHSVAQQAQEHILHWTGIMIDDMFRGHALQVLAVDAGRSGRWQEAGQYARRAESMKGHVANDFQRLSYWAARAQATKEAACGAMVGY